MDEGRTDEGKEREQASKKKKEEEGTQEITYRNYVGKEKEVVKSDGKLERRKKIKSF